eukprot:gene9580-36171_t
MGDGGAAGRPAPDGVTYGAAVTALRRCGVGEERARRLSEEAAAAGLALGLQTAGGGRDDDR